MDQNGYPEVGDEFEQVRGFPGVSEHIIIGSIFKVITVVNGLVTFDKCNCPSKKGSGAGCQWGWDTYKVIYKYIEKFTQEEVDKAHRLPDNPEDIFASFFTVTHGNKQIS